MCALRRLLPLASKCCALIACAYGAGLAAAPRDADDAFAIELSGGRLFGNGAQSNELSRDIKDIDDGTAWRLAGAWRFHDHWYVTGSYAESRYEYSDPSAPFCPLTSLINALCFTQSVPREGQIHDSVAEWQVALGYRYPWSPRTALFVEAGYGDLRWDSDDDLEANNLAECVRRTGQAPVSGCTPLSTHAHDSGVLANVGAKFAVGARGEFGIGWHFQDYRYRVFRNDLQARFFDANCSDQPGNPCPDLPQDGSWTWASVSGAYRFAEHWAAIVNVEFGGSRDWEGASTGVRFSW